MSRARILLGRATCAALLLAAPGCGGASPETRTTTETTQANVAEPNDRCPDAPEDRDGFEDDDGCPDPDNDGDRVPDTLDQCPCVAEDADGFEDDDGCPDPDNDGDNIADGCDQCPDAPETYQGNCDEDGCPDRSHVCVAQSRIVIGERVGFAASSSAVEGETAALVDALARSLVVSPHIERIEVVGRAVPSERGASGLARTRAESVVAALVAAGVDAARLTARAERPRTAAEDDVLEGRFVDFVIVRAGGEDWPGGNPPQGSAYGGCAPPICEPVPPCTATPPPEPVCDTTPAR